MTNCSYHCLRCDSCFRDKAAFDRHRLGGICGKADNLMPVEGWCARGVAPDARPNESVVWVERQKVPAL
jgi:hypothetical protein